jgi:hypothetical protein
LVEREAMKLRTIELIGLHLPEQFDTVVSDFVVGALRFDVPMHVNTFWLRMEWWKHPAFSVTRMTKLPRN